ncbi:MAG: hypothetical protein AAGD33_15375 [Actinomycetota bacterium]
MTERAAMFDRIIVVDWSARSTPATGRDSIWVACVDQRDSSHDRRATATWNPPTRRVAVDLLADLVVTSSGRTLVTIDASVGYPSGTADALGLGACGVGGTPPWRRLWTELSESIIDDERNRNNRFVIASEWNRRIAGRPGPFWGCPPAARTETLTSTKPPHPAERIPEWRACERALRSAGRRPFSCWQLLGVGSVASQSLLAIVALDRLHRRLASRDVIVDVWPLTTGLDRPSGRVTVAECWPSLFVQGAGADDDRVRDERQVVETAEVLRERDLDGALARWFAPGLPDDVATAAVDEEGWILGVDSAG